MLSGCCCSGLRALVSERAVTVPDPDCCRAVPSSALCCLSCPPGPASPSGGSARVRVPLVSISPDTTYEEVETALQDQPAWQVRTWAHALMDRYEHTQAYQGVSSGFISWFYAIPTCVHTSTCTLPPYACWCLWCLFAWRWYGVVVGLGAGHHGSTCRLCVARPYEPQHSSQPAQNAPASIRPNGMHLHMKWSHHLHMQLS